MRTGSGIGSDTVVTSASRAAAWLLAILLVTGAALRFYRLGEQSFWLDELWTAVASDPGLSLERWLTVWVIPDVHPPLYQFLARGWQAVAGGSESSLRLMSVLFSGALVAIVPLVHRWVLPVTRQPLALAAWFACSTGAVLYAREARAYALLVLLAAVATLLGAAIARRMERGEAIALPVVALGATIVTAEYSHYFGALVGGGVFGALWLFSLYRDRRYLATLTLAGVLSIAALLPWLLFHAPYLQGKTGGYFWIQNNWSATLPAAADYAAGAPALFLVICAAVALILVRHPYLPGRPAYFLPLVMIGLIAVAALGISLHTPVITPRNLMILVPPFYLLVMVSFDALLEERSRLLRTAGILAPVLVVAVNLGFTIDHVAKERKDDWRGTAAYVAALPGCRDAPLPVNFWPPQIYAYYLPAQQRSNLVPVNVQSLDRAPRRMLDAASDACPLVLWSAHMTGDRIVRETLELLGRTERDVVVRRHRGHLLILDKNRTGRPQG